jgi:eukaryotic-like serine/threonine-protein kinase
MSKQLGRYVLDRELGVGGMARIYLARQQGPDGFERICVVKCVLDHLIDDGESVKMFLDEARLTAQLNHPNIAQIYDFGENDGTYFLAMEYIAGCDLSAILKRNTERSEFMPVPVAARIASQLATALDYAHHALGTDGRPLNIVHRDVSPENILVTASGGVKLIDFGIAKSATARLKTQAGMVKGKVAYMSPEQAVGGVLDGRSDIFSLGLVLFEMLTNRSPVEKADEATTMEAIASGDVAAIESYRHDVPADLRAVVAKALHADPALRYPTAGQMAAELDRYIARSGVHVAPGAIAALVVAATSRLAPDAITDPSSNPGPPPETTQKSLADPTRVARQGELKAGPQDTVATALLQAAGPAKLVPPAPQPAPALSPPARRSPFARAFMIAVVTGIVAGAVIMWLLRSR